MSRVVLACALAALIPVAARAEPISMGFNSGSGGFAASGDPWVNYRTIDLGQIYLPGGSASGTFFFNDAKVWRDYNVNFDVILGAGVTGFHVELLDPLGDGDDALDTRRIRQRGQRADLGDAIDAELTSVYELVVPVMSATEHWAGTSADASRAHHTLISRC
jgi:hypothetical protein